ncbi:hypothetical protein [Streptomyces sp. XH2]|uniref:hypothetical protein n=1 Tax=Streptomyces sp. XH2 TaxID=3412483 RepID=UPI003C7C3177
MRGSRIMVVLLGACALLTGGITGGIAGGIPAEAATPAPRPGPAPGLDGNGVLIENRLFHDASGLVTVGVYELDGASAQSIWTEAKVRVPDPDMIVIGGGAIGTDWPEGAYLTASYPDWDKRAWVVSTKDHINRNEHIVKAYAIGLKIQGISAYDLANMAKISPSDNVYGQYPSAEIGVGSNDYALVGGGFRIDWKGWGNMATASYPNPGSNYTTWKASSKDHLHESPASIKSYAIGLPRWLPQIGRSLESRVTTAPSFESRKPGIGVDVQDGFALTGGGAFVEKHTGAGNLIWKMEPRIHPNPGFDVASKEHNQVDTATIRAFALGIRIG